MTRSSAPPYGALLEEARNDAKLSIREAARRSGISDAWWRSVVSGSQNGAPAHGSPETVAAMARTVGVTPEQLATEGKNAEAAEALRKILRDEASAAIVPAATRPVLVHDGAGPEAEFAASVIALLPLEEQARVITDALDRLRPEDQQVIRAIMRMEDEDGPLSWEQKMAIITPYVAQHGRRRRSAAG